MPGRIVLLDEGTASRIAAGEVVERPASAVKELVENSIDAEAREIRVILEDGGKRRIEVADDGCGMDREECVLAVQRHATSKIRTAEDLASVRTLGFRGEALPSIASVSRFTLISKTDELDSGCKLVIHGGDVIAVEDAVSPTGTTVVVEDLFYNTPARLKFLKSTGTELSRCIEVVGLLALAHPDRVFRLTHNGQEVLATPGGGDLVGTLARVWTRDLARKLVGVRHEEAAVVVEGVVATPDASRPGRTHQVFIVNGRPVRSRLLGHALEQAFRDVTPESRYPVCCLHLRMEPSLVDVNVHPTKLEVKFAYEQEVHAAVYRTVRKALVEHGILPEIGRPETRWTPPAAPPSGRPSQHAVQVAVTGLAPPDELPQGGVSGAVWPPAAEPRPDQSEISMEELLRGFEVLGQAARTFIVATTEQGIVLVDQHVAHERVLYERLRQQHSEHGIPSQRLAVPVTLTLGPAEFALVQQHLAAFRSAGWELEPFGGRALVIRSAPALLKQGRYEGVLRDMVDELVHHSVARRLVVERDQVLITHACRLAVKAGDELSKQEMTALLKQLAETRNPHLCPHGRPAAVLVSYSEMERRFKR